jgi:hypothetical protein
MADNGPQLPALTAGFMAFPLPPHEKFHCINAVSPRQDAYQCKNHPPSSTAMTAGAALSVERGSVAIF